MYDEDSAGVAPSEVEVAAPDIPYAAAADIPYEHIPYAADILNKTAAQRTKQWREAHPEQHREYMRQYMRRRRADKAS